MTTYPFRRVDNGEIVQVDWETMIGAKAQRITLPDGVEAIRVNPKPQQLTQRQLNCGANFEVVSDGFGCIEDAVAANKATAEMLGLRNIRWVQETGPHAVPGFYTYHCTSPEEHRRWKEHVEGSDNAEHLFGGGVYMSAESLAEAQRRTIEKYGPAPAA